MDKPATAEGYPPEFDQVVRSACLYLATKCGDIRDELVVVGGLVPSLLIEPGVDTAPHVGTRDLDLGLKVGLLEEERYQDLTDRLREAGFQPDVEHGKIIRQRWKLDDGGHRMTVDFLIAPTDRKGEPGKLLSIQHDFAAFITPGLELAFQDRQEVQLSGQTLQGEQATRSIWVCGPAAFIVLKALAFRNRGANKDAYDLFYVLRHHRSGVASIAHSIRAFGENEHAARALGYLAEDFATLDSIGPRRVAQFLGDPGNDDLLADVVGFVQSLLASVN